MPDAMSAIGIPVLTAVSRVPVTARRQSASIDREIIFVPHLSQEFPLFTAERWEPGWWSQPKVSPV